MKTRGKNKALFLTLYLLSALIYVLGSCSGDNDLTGSSDLSISMQIPTTRSADPEAPIDFNKRTYQTPKVDDECGLFALTEVKKGTPTHDIDGYDNVGEYYQSMNEYARKNYGYEGGAMNTKYYMALANTMVCLLTASSSAVRTSLPYSSRMRTIKKMQKSYAFKRMGKTTTQNIME